MKDSIQQTINIIGERTMNMLPPPCLNWEAARDYVMSEDMIEASRLVASFTEPMEASLKGKLLCGPGNMDFEIPCPEKRLITPAVGFYKLEFDLMADEPPEWLEPLCHWFQNVCNLQLELFNMAWLLDIMTQKMTIEQMKLIWPDMPLLFQTSVRDRYHHQGRFVFLEAFDKAKLPKQHIYLWPGIDKDIERAKQTIGRALLADEDQHVNAPQKGEVVVAIYRRFNRNGAQDVLDIHKRAQTEPSAWYFT